MPYGIRRSGSHWQVIRKAGPLRSTKVLGTHNTEESARKQLAAIEANTGGK